MDTVRIERFTSRIHAELACSMLVAHGFNARVSGDDVAGIHPDIPYGIGGTAIELPRTQLEEANALLDEEFAGDFGDDTLAQDRFGADMSAPGEGAPADGSGRDGNRRPGLRLFAAVAAFTMLVVFASVTGTTAGWWG